MPWWGWLIVGVVAWVVVAFTVAGVFAWRQYRRVSRMLERDDGWVRLGPPRRGGARRG